MTQTDMQPSDQQDLRMLRESARTLFERAGGSGRSRKLRDAGGGWDAGMIREMAEAGIFGVTVPEEDGGLGMGLAAGGVIAEEVGRVIAPEPVVVTVGLSLGLLRRLCPDHAMMEQLVEGATVLAVAWQERGPNGGPAEPSCRYADGKLTGSKGWVAGAGGACRSGSCAGGGRCGRAVRRRAQAGRWQRDGRAFVLGHACGRIGQWGCGSGRARRGGQ